MELVLIQSFVVYVILSELPSNSQDSVDPSVNFRSASHDFLPSLMMADFSHLSLSTIDFSSVDFHLLFHQVMIAVHQLNNASI
jgi:hypothetical protein